VRVTKASQVDAKTYEGELETDHLSRLFPIRTSDNNYFEPLISGPGEKHERAFY
jgi:hypothetical protein